MRPSASIVATILGLTLLAASLLAACGGGSDGRPNLRNVPTATAYATLPAPTIVSGSVLAGSSSAESTYVVEPGDSVSAIAARLGVDVEELIRLNDLADPSRLEVGQVLRVPALPTEAGAAPPAQTAQTTPVPAGEMQTYVVASGDNASDIAARFGVTLEELAAANNTTIDGLRVLEVDQVLNIPPPSLPPAPEPIEEPVEAPPPEPTPTEVPIEEPTPEQPVEGPPPEAPLEPPAEGTPP